MREIIGSFKVYFMQFFSLRFSLAAVLIIGFTSQCSKPASPNNPEIDKDIVFQPGTPFQKPVAHFPGVNWPKSTPEAEGLDPEAVKKLDEYLSLRSGDDTNRLGIRTNAFLLIRNGKIVFEKYERGYTPDSAMLTWSVSKSITNILAGIAVKQGRIDINQPAYKCEGDLDTDDAHRSIRLRHLLQMSSSLGYDESYEASPVYSSVIAMLYTRGHNDMAKFTANHPLVAAAGMHWNYSSGDSNIVSACLKHGISTEEYNNLPWVELFNPLQIKNAVWEQDQAGTFVGSSYLYLRPQDLAKIGYLFMQDGVWNGKRLLPEGWVRYSLSVVPAYYNREKISVSEREDNPGAYWYANIGNPDKGLEKPWPEAPDDTFAGLGHWGKGLWVIPSLDMVIVRLGDDRRYGCRWNDQPGCETDVEKGFSKRHLLTLVMETVKK